MSRKFTYSDVAAHAERHDMWVVIYDKVLDFSQFVNEHPGGEEVLVDQAGKDATAAFEDVGHSPDALQILETLSIGTLDKKAGIKEAKTDGTKSSSQWPNSTIKLLVFLGIVATYAAYSVK